MQEKDVLGAAKRCKLEYVPVVIKKVTEQEKMALAIIENIQRSDLNCIEEALANFRLMDEFKLTQEEVAKRLGKRPFEHREFIKASQVTSKSRVLFTARLIIFRPW